MENKIKAELDGISTELSALADTFEVLEEANQSNAVSLPPLALYAPTMQLHKLSDQLESIVKQLFNKEQPQ